MTVTTKQYCLSGVIVWTREVFRKTVVGDSGPIRIGPYFVFLSLICRPIHETKTKYGLVRIGPLFENGAPQRQAVGTFDVCLAQPKVCPTDIVRRTRLNL